MFCLASILLSRPYFVCVYGMYAVEVGLSLVLAVRVCRFHGSSYLLRAVSIVLEDGGEKFYFLGEGIFFTESFGCVCQGSEECLFVSRIMMRIVVYVDTGMGGFPIYFVP